MFDAVPLVYRGRLVVADHGRAVALALLVVGSIALAGAAWTATHPPTVEVTEPVATATVGTDVGSRAVVTGDSSLWARGTVLEDRPVYPLALAPRLTLEVHTTVPADRTVVVEHALTLVYRAERDGEVFWDRSRPLLAASHTVRDGDVADAVTLDVTAVRSELDELNAELTGLGRARAYLRLDVRYRADGLEGRLGRAAPLSVKASGYWIDGSLDAEAVHRSPVTREVSRQADPTTLLGLGVLGLVSYAGAGGVLLLSRRRLDREAVAEALERRRYAEWISAGRLDEVVADRAVPMDSLKDLVNVAIDSKNRVVHDPRRELFAVVAADVVYHYDPDPTAPELDVEGDVRVPLRHDGGWPPAAAGDPEERLADPGVADRPTDAATVTRTMGVERGTLVATYRLSTSADEPVVVEVLDGAVEADGPVPGYEPGGTVDAEAGVGFTAAVSPHWARLVKFAVRTDEPGPIESSPTVSRVATMGPADRTDRGSRWRRP